MKLLADFLGGIIHIIAMYYFFSSFLSHYKVRKETALIVYAVNGLYGILFPMVTATPPERILCSIIYIAAPLFLYRDKFSVKLIIFMAYYVLLGFSELLVKALLLGHLGDLSLYYANFEYHYFIGVLTSSILAFVLFYTFSVSTTLLRNKYPIYLQIVLLAVPIFSSVVFYYLQEIVCLSNTQSAYNAFCYITIILLLFNLFVVFTISRIAQASELKTRVEYEKKQIREQQNYHKNLAVYHQKVRQLSHDVHNHLLILHHALQEQDYLAAEQYIQKQLTLLDANRTGYSGYLLLDTILDYKLQIARCRKIRMQIHTALAPDLEITDDLTQDFCMMLGSVLDNAIEASEKIKDSTKRKITIHIRNDDVYLSCRIENSIASPVQIVDNRIPATGKQDAVLHGLGLQNVKRLAEQYQGHLLLECKEDIFVTSFVVNYR